MPFARQTKLLERTSALDQFSSSFCRCKFEILVKQGQVNTPFLGLRQFASRGRIGDELIGELLLLRSHGSRKIVSHSTEPFNRGVAARSMAS
jgi:hypothetical protein